MENEEKDLGYVDYWEMAPVGDTFMCSTVPDKTKKETETGLIITTQTDIVMDRPFKGVVVAVGPEAKYKVGDYLWWQPTAGLDLAMVRPTKEDEKFIMLHNDAVIAKRVKDTRK